MIAKQLDKLPEDHQLRPIKINNIWENDEKRDILFYYGIRKRFASQQAVSGLYANNSTEKPVENDHPKREQFLSTIVSTLPR